MVKRKAVAVTVSPESGDAYEVPPAVAEAQPAAVDVVNRVAESTKMPDAPKTNIPPVEKVKDHDGVFVGRDRYYGKMRVRLAPDMNAEDFRELLTAEIKPILYTKHQLQGENGQPGPEVNFHYNPNERDWEMTYRFTAKDAEGNTIKEADGTSKKVYYTKQVETIATRTAQQIADLLDKKLGRHADDKEIPF